MAENADLAELHRRVAVADGHADSLMWNRDLNDETAEGHVDFLRLREAGVKLQCFTIVTRGLPFIDGFSLFARKRGWPAQARASEWARCNFQIDRLEAFCRASAGAASIAAAPGDIERNLEQGVLSAIIGVEGAHAIEGRLDRVKELHQRGVRFMSLTHLSNNELGGTSTPFSGNRPLTPLGREVLDAMGAVGMAIDVSHAAPSMLDTLLSHPHARPFCSHAGVRSVRKLWRNLSDESLRKIADRGGVVGIIFVPWFLGGDHLEDLAAHIERAVAVMGEDGVGFGSDFDGMVSLPEGMRDVRDLPKVTGLLLQRGMPVRVVEKVLGENFRRFFTELLAGTGPKSPTVA